MTAQCQGDPALWRFVYPNAKALVSINWQRVRQSPAAMIIRDQWLSGGKSASVPGIELIDDIDRVVISSPGSPIDASKDSADDANGDPQSDAAGAPAELPFMIAVHGHFDAVKVRKFFALLHTKPQAYNSFQVYRPQDKGAKDMAYVLFDAGTVLFGDAPSIFAALDRNQFAPPAPEPGSIVARAAEMDAAYDFWLSMSTPDIMSSNRLAGLFRGEWAADAQGFEAGVSLRSGLTADMTLRFGSEPAAKHVIAEMSKLTGAISKDRNAEQDIRDITKRLKFSSDGAAVKISLRLTPQELEKSAQAFAAGNKAALAAAAAADPAPLANASRPAAPVAVPGKPGVIRIEGLDDGPREIPYPDRQPDPQR